MARKGGRKGTAQRHATLSDVDALLSRVLTGIRANPSHPQWSLLIRGVTAMQEINEVLCRLTSGGGDSDFGAPGISRR